MTKRPDADIPPFLSPLTHDQHAQLGRLAILWGQLDLVLDNLLDKALGLTPKQRQTLVGEKPIGIKLSMLAKHFDDIPVGEARTLAKQFWDLANQTKEQRNRCFHGVWGWWASPRKTLIPAAAHFKSKENPVKATDFDALELKLCRATRAGFEALRLLKQFSEFSGCSRLTHGPSKPPDWLQEWLEQHPLDDRSLDHRHKDGQLPFLEHPEK